MVSLVGVLSVKVVALVGVLSVKVVQLGRHLVLFVCGLEEGGGGGGRETVRVIEPQ